VNIPARTDASCIFTGLFSTIEDHAHLNGRTIGEL
jgi:hypothetical protein